MSTVGTKMKAIADEIRVLSGATDTLSLTEMATHVNTANTDIAEMENLIAELEEALDGKSVPGEEPSVETCTVEILSLGKDWVVHYSGVDGLHPITFSGNYDSVYLEVVKNTLLTVETIVDYNCNSYSDNIINLMHYPHDMTGGGYDIVQVFYVTGDGMIA